LNRLGYNHIPRVGAAWAREGPSTNAIERSWAHLRRMIAVYNTCPPH